MLLHVIASLFSDSCVAYTSLRDLNGDRFEIVNLCEKLLIIINDAEKYQGDYSVLKAFTGQDTVKGSIKYIQGSVQVIPRGIILAAGNFAFNPGTDKGNALGRRLVPFSANNVSHKRDSLIVKKPNGTWEGPLAEERSGILKWALGIEEKQALSFILEPQEHVKSFKNTFTESEQALSPLSSWVSEYLYNDPTEATQIGVKGGNDKTQLYPSYRKHCEETGIISIPTLRSFSSDLLIYLSNNGYTGLGKVRKEQGFFLKGVGFQGERKNIPKGPGAPCPFTHAVKGVVHYTPPWKEEEKSGVKECVDFGGGEDSPKLDSGAITPTPCLKDDGRGYAIDPISSLETNPENQTLIGEISVYKEYINNPSRDLVCQAKEETKKLIHHNNDIT